MCGIVGATSERRISEILIEGLKRLEYRGYDSAGLAVLNDNGDIELVRRVGKVQALKDAVGEQPLSGTTGIAHTRWATHGGVTEANAHPHISGNCIAVVHNGIIENHDKLRQQLQQLGYTFNSDTDTEVICHWIHHERKKHDDFFAAVQATIKHLEGAYGTLVMDCRNPGRLVVARSGSPFLRYW